MRTILIVDDSPMDVDLTKHALHKCAITNPVLHVNDGGAALWHLSVDTNVSMVLLDLHMRVISGLEFLTFFRAHPKNDHIPVIILSGSRNADERMQAEQLGADAFVFKDPDLEAFITSLATVFIRLNWGGEE